ncbi:hypothetical protein RFI_36772, partial [Reticulomyxa filosa]
ALLSYCKCKFFSFLFKQIITKTLCFFLLKNKYKLINTPFCIKIQIFVLFYVYEAMELSKFQNLFLFDKEQSQLFHFYNFFVINKNQKGFISHKKGNTFVISITQISTHLFLFSCFLETQLTKKKKKRKTKKYSSKKINSMLMLHEEEDK